MGEWYSCSYIVLRVRHAHIQQCSHCRHLLVLHASMSIGAYGSPANIPLDLRKDAEHYSDFTGHTAFCMPLLRCLASRSNMPETSIIPSAVSRILGVASMIAEFGSALANGQIRVAGSSIFVGGIMQTLYLRKIEASTADWADFCISLSPLSCTCTVHSRGGTRP